MVGGELRDNIVVWWGALRDDPKPCFQETTETTQPNKSDLTLYVRV